MAIKHKVYRFSDHVRHARELKGWSQERLAQGAGVSQTTIDKIERGETKRSRFAPEIATALGITVSDLTRETTIGIQIDEEAKVVISEVPHLQGMMYVQIAEDGPNGILIFSPNVAIQVPKPNIISGNEEVFALLLSSSTMSPEFESGDILYVLGKRPPLLQRAMLFCDREGELVNGVLGRLIHFDDDRWQIIRWQGSAAQIGARPEAISRKAFPIQYQVLQRVCIFNLFGG